VARLGRSQPIPVKTLGRLRYSRAAFTLGAFEIPVEWPTISVSTPNANLNLGAFEIPVEWPTLTLNREQRLTLAAFEVTAEWPALSVSVPAAPGDNMTGADGEIEYNGFILGGGQDLYRVTELEGWEDLPNVVSGNTERPTRDGSYSGGKYTEERIVIATVQMADDSPTFAQNLKAFRDATGIVRDGTELPLVVRMRGETLLAYGAVTGRKAPTGLVGVGVIQFVVRWTCSDPRRYSLDLQGATVPLNAPTGLSNDGNSESHPLIYIPGPAENPVLINSTLDRTLAFDLEIPDGELLELDTDNATATLSGESQMSHLTGTSVPVGDFVLGGGTNTIQYTAAAGGEGGADFLWRHAHQ
jgi:hypothetical protein